MKRIIVPCNNQGLIERRLKDLLENVCEEFEDVQVVRSRCALPSRARNNGITGKFTDLSFPAHMITCDVYIFIDADVIPCKEGLVRILTESTVDTFATGLYEARGSKDFAVGRIMGYQLPKITKDEIHSCETADWAGAGLLIVGKNVLLRMRNPYFHESVIAFVDDQNIDRSTIIGEDVTFCISAKGVGAILRILPYLTAEHLTNNENMTEEGICT